MARNNQIFSQFAPRLYDLDYSPIPLSGKVARIKKWPARFCDERPKREEMVGEYARGHRGNRVMNGIGLATHNGLMFVDIDADGLLHDNAYKLIREVVPVIDRAPKVIGKRGAKYLLRIVGLASSAGLNLTSFQTDGQVELLVHHRLGVIPPTVHPDTDAPYHFDPDVVRQDLFETRLDDLATITLAELAQIREIFSVRTSGTRPGEVSRRIDEQRRAESDRNKWDGNNLEMRRAAKALSFLHAYEADTWWKVGAALKNWTNGNPLARELFDTWAGGGSFMEIEFPGAPDKFNKTKTQDAAWSQERPDIRYGTIIHLARQKGFDATLRQWRSLKLARKQIDAQRRQSCASPFDLAAKQLPRANMDFFNALDALRTRALNDRKISRSDVRLLDQILLYVNQKAGYAWPSYERLSEAIDISEQQLYKHATKLERAGYIIRAQNNSNPDGSNRTAFGILPPSGMTWQRLLARHRQQMGHEQFVQRASAEVLTTALEQGHRALSCDPDTSQTGGAIQPGFAADNSGKAGQADPDTTNRESSSGCVGDEERPTRERIEPRTRSIDKLVRDGLLENEKLIELMQVCSKDQIGAGVVQSVSLMIERALTGVDGMQEPDRRIALSDQLVRWAVDKAVRSAFDPLRPNDRRSKRVDLDLTGGNESRDCLRIFRGKFETELGKLGYETASYRQRKATWKR